eukprot:scpid63957/ scgid30018/ 
MTSKSVESAAVRASRGVSVTRRLAGTKIVDPSTILDSKQLHMEEWSERNLTEEIQDNESLMCFLARRKVIRNEWECKSCNRFANLDFDAKNIDGCGWMCRRCTRSWWIRVKSNVNCESHSLLEIMSLFHFLLDLPIAQNSVVGSRLLIGAIDFTVPVFWMVSMSYDWLFRNMRLGGTHIVFVDMYKPTAKSNWIYIAVEDSTNLAVVEPKVSVNTLSAFVDRCCNPQSRIAYRYSSSIRVYNRLRWKDQDNFVDVEDPSSSPQLEKEHRDAIDNAIAELSIAQHKLRVLEPGTTDEISSRPMKRKTQIYKAWGTVLSLRRYFAISINKNPLSFLLNFLRLEDDSELMED